MRFTHTVKTQKSLDVVIQNLAENLKEIGFGVLEIIDLKILTEKGPEFSNNYKLMEGCYPNLAKQVLKANPDLGLLLPCTIAIYQKNNENYISLAKPTSLLEMAPVHTIFPVLNSKVAVFGFDILNTAPENCSELYSTLGNFFLYIIKI